MIPKKIHYCWFGHGEKSKLMKKCINSWKKFCPDFEIIEWNEDNFDVHQNAYTAYVYDNKKYAFLSDYARLFIVYHEGGIYLDTDVELIKPLDSLLVNEAYFGFENDAYINTGLGFGSVKENPILKSLLNEYEYLLDGNHGTVGCPVLNTRALVKNGLALNGEMQDIKGTVVYPASYFNPLDDATGRLELTKDTYSIHHYAKSWMSKKKVIRSYLTRPLHRIFGKEFFRKN